MYKPLFYIILFLLAFKAMGQKDTLQIQQLFDKAYLLEASSPKEALQLYKKTHLLSLKNSYNMGIFRSLQYSGIVHSNNGSYDSAIFYYEKSKNFCAKTKYHKGEAQNYTNIGNAYQFKGDYSKATKYYLLGIKIFEKIKDSADLSLSYQNLSAVYTSFKNKKLELFYLKKAEEFNTNSNKERLGLLYGDIGLLLLKQKKHQEALVYFKKTEALTKIDSSKKLAFFSARNLGEYYNHIEKYSQAIPYYEKAMALSEINKDLFQKSDLLYILSGTYLNSKTYKKALDYGLQSLALAKKIGAKDILFLTQKRLSIIYNKLNQPKKAYQLLEESYTLKDSVLNENHVKQMTLVQTQFETEKKDNSITEQQIKLKKQELNLIKSQKEKQFYYIVSILLIMLSFGLWYFFRQRQKIKDKEIISLQQQQEITKLEALIDGEENERRRIAQELHDGLNGDLSAIKYRLSTLEDAGLCAMDAENLTKVIDMIDESCAQVRSISHNLMPASIVDYGLLETIREFCSKINSSQTVKIDFQFFGIPIEFPQKIETVIYRIIQELITNVLKHSKATEAMIQFNYREDEFFINVEDNGIGFDKTVLSNGIGLKNIKTRVEFLNAQLEVDSSPKGTFFTISIDLNKI